MQKKKEILERANNKPNYSITHDMTNIYTEAFSIFFKIGAFTIGGGYAMVPLIEDEIVTKRRWIFTVIRVGDGVLRPTVKTLISPVAWVSW